MTTTEESGFKFWVPAEISKAKTVTGKEKWVFKGIASTADEDTDGEVLVPQGFDLSYFLTDGFVNWNHQSKNNPSAIIGEPIKAEIRPEGMYVETELYQGSEVAKGVWELGQILEKSKSGRKLGFSIEGKVLEKDPDDENKIIRAKITGLAITPSPKNKSTFADVVKGHSFNGDWEMEDLVEGDLDLTGPFVVDINDGKGNRITIDKALNINIEKAEKGTEEEEETEESEEEKKKSLDTTAGAPVTPSNFSTANPHFKPDEKKNLKNVAGETLDTSPDSSNLKKKLTKSEVYEVIFTHATTDIEKADKIYQLIEQVDLKSSYDMKKGTLSMDSIKEAFSKLNIDFEKGETQDKPGMTNAQADTTPTVADNTGMGGDADGLSLDMVVGMYKAMDGVKDKKEYVSKAIEKGVKSEMAEKAYSKAVEKGIIKADDSDEDDDMKKAEDKMKNAKDEAQKAEAEYERIKKGKVKKSADSEDDDEDEDDDSEKGLKKGKKDKKIMKALTETALLMKGMVDQNTDLIKAIGEQKDTFEKALSDQKKDFDKKIEEISSTPVGRRSVQTAEFLEKGLKDTFEKAEKEGKTVINLSSPQDSHTFLNMLDKKTFEKGTVDPFYGNLMAQMELGPDNALAALKGPGVLDKIQSELSIKLVA